MEQFVVNTASNILNKKVFFIKRLLGGMSNYTCVIKDEDGNFYTFRIPGKNANNFVDRLVEKANLDLLNDFELTNKTIYIDTNVGYKISSYIEGDILSQIENKNSYLSEVAKTLVKLHKIDKKCQNDYDKLGRLTKYENLVKELNYDIDDRYFQYKEEYLKLYNEFENIEKCISHGDFQPSNLILVNNEVFVVDFEFTANNDPYYDIACYGNNDFEDAKLLLKEYLGRDYTNYEFRRLIENRLFQTLQWHLVATYKNLIGLSEELKLDFGKIADIYLQKSKILLETL